MALTDAAAQDARVAPSGPGRSGPPAPPRDLQRTFQLVLATLWLFDALLQIQPFMFTRGAAGFSGMLDRAASGNPDWIARSITWDASIVYHQPILTNAIFAGIQFLIAFGIVYKRTCKPALVLSIAWSLSVWWFGEGLGAIFSGGTTPFGGGPGSVLLYAVLAVLTWPNEGSDRPFVAARTIGSRRAKALWALLWLLLAVLCLVGSGRSPQALRDVVEGLEAGEPGWLARIDRSTESLFLHSGTTFAILLAVVCVVVAAGVYLAPPITRFVIVLAVVVFGLIWIAVQNFGGVLVGGATDPNGAPLLMLIALTYWPLPASPGLPNKGGCRPVTIAGMEP